MSVVEQQARPYRAAAPERSLPGAWMRRLVDARINSRQAHADRRARDYLTGLGEERLARLDLAGQGLGPR